MTEQEAYTVGWHTAQHVHVEHDFQEAWSMLNVDCPHEIANNEVLHTAWMRGFDERCAGVDEIRYTEESDKR